jgi:sec-independent protein translocase protein TatA
MGMPSGFELLIIVAAIVLLFGGKKIPELAKGLGQGIKNFKTAIKDDNKEEENVVKTENINNTTKVANASDVVEDKTKA